MEITHSTALDESCGAVPILLPSSRKFFDVLQYLLRNRQRVVSKDDLIAAVWGGRIVSESTVSSRINAVRHAIGDTGDEQRFIKTLPRKGVRFVGVVRENEETTRIAATSIIIEPSRAVLTIPDKPSIAVLPFENLSGDREQEYFADGMVEEIITALSRFRQLFESLAIRALSTRADL